MLSLMVVLVTTTVTEAVLLDDNDLSERVSTADYQKIDLPERPLQLVRPDSLQHQKLEIIDENVQYLHYIDSAVAVVAVVGKFHSGKSFLLNQLMGKQNGFGIGPSVKPQTMGIWMWGKPMKVKLPSGDPLSVIFLDTEGFAANNVTESYDAKIFSVATLLSSYLLYNSVKIIDQADIDYLELLSRRTQLFALRSQITRSKWFDQFNHDLLKFPPLMWVVQDFVQATENETPRQWLHSIMETSSRESNDYNINLLGLFDSVDCHTLFLPATKRSLLQDLSQATEDDLTPEYKEERNVLMQQLLNGLVPKEKNGQAITGPEFATLLEILVTAANDGSLAKIPGRWEVFISELKVNALEDCVKYYESDMNLIIHKYNNGPINETELEIWHYSALEKAQNLLKQLLLGLESALKSALGELLEIASEKFEMTTDLNVKKIQLKCSEVQQKVEIKTEERLKNLLFPIATVELHKIQEKITLQALEDYVAEVGHLSDDSAYHRQHEQLKTGLQYIYDGIILKNNAAFEKLLHESINLAIDKFKDLSKNSNQIPRNSEALEKVISLSSTEARKVFEASSLLCHNESLYPVFKGLLENKLQEAAEECNVENRNLVREACKVKADELYSQFNHNIGGAKLILPINDDELENRLESETGSSLDTYAELMAVFKDNPAFKEVETYLKNKLKEACAQRREDNYKAYIKEVEIPLKTAKKLILLSADHYDTEFALHQYMIEVCMLNLDEGKAGNWEESLKLKIAHKFVQSSQELQDVIASKLGPWSTIKGFIQWIIWYLGGMYSKFLTLFF